MEYSIELRRTEGLKEHPDNPRKHPELQVEHLQESLRRLGVYRNVVCTPDGTILAGHGVWLAAQAEGIEELPVLVFDGDETEARRLLLADNALARLAQDDVRKLYALVVEQREDLVGTGVDEGLLQSLKAIAEAEESYKEAGDFGATEGGAGSGRGSRIVVECDTEEQVRAVVEAVGAEWKEGRKTYTYAT